MTWEKDFDVDVRRIRALVKFQLGASTIEFDDQVVPAELRDLVPIAHLLGIGDDGVRAEVIESMSKEFENWVKSRVLPKRLAIMNWVATKPWDAARSAFLALEEGFGSSDAVVEPDRDVAAAILEDLKRLKL